MTATQQSPRNIIAAYQSYLNDMGFKAGPNDGIWGPRTQAAHLAYTDSKSQSLPVTNDLITNDVRAIQKEIGVKVDGNFGPASRSAAKRYLEGLCPNNPFPTYAGRTAFYGSVGVRGGFTPPMKSFTPAFSIFLYDSKTPVARLSAHAKCADSLENVFKDLAKLYNSSILQTQAGINKFFGIYNPRPVRHGKSPSNHGWGIAIDLDANRNGLFSNWPTRAKMPWEVIKIFARHGWSNGGIIWGRDAMHFEAVRS
jgi:peptidoglycan hydrolase-like protein with peptidoglycan-binding domain